MDLLILITFTLIVLLFLAAATQQSLFVLKLRNKFKNADILIATRDDPGIGKLVAQYIRGAVTEYGVNIHKDEIDLKLIIERNIREIKKIVNQSLAKNIVIYNGDILCRNSGKHINNLKVLFSQNDKRLILVTEQENEVNGFVKIDADQIGKISKQHKNRNKVSNIKSLVLVFLVALSAVISVMSIDIIVYKQSSARNIEKAVLLYDLYKNRHCGICLEHIKNAGLKGHMLSAVIYQTVYTERLRENGQLNEFNPGYVLSLPAPKNRIERILFRKIIKPLIDDGLVEKSHLKDFTQIEPENENSFFMNWYESYEEPNYYDLEFVSKKMEETNKASIGI